MLGKVFYHLRTARDILKKGFRTLTTKNDLATYAEQDLSFIHSIEAKSCKKPYASGMDAAYNLKVIEGFLNSIRDGKTVTIK